MDGDIYNEDTNDEDIDDEETNEEFYEATYTYVMAIYALIDILNQFLNMMRGEHIERPLTRRQITSRGYDYIHKALNDDPAIFRQVYKMYPDVFRKLCTIIREKTPLEDTRFICVEEMLASFLQIVGQNTRYCVIRNTFGRSQFATSENFHKILKALNSLAPDLMVRPDSTVPAKIRESTRFYPYFKSSRSCALFRATITKAQIRTAAEPRRDFGTATLPCALPTTISEPHRSTTDLNSLG
ncbi:hypothetical protein GmHk_09G026284 [Glycine max]|nr:hypothetical protein GmHk_09G026284 [Glycine max]